MNLSSLIDHYAKARLDMTRIAGVFVKAADAKCPFNIKLVNPRTKNVELTVCERMPFPMACSPTLCPRIEDEIKRLRGGGE